MLVAFLCGHHCPITDAAHQRDPIAEVLAVDAEIGSEFGDLLIATSPTKRAPSLGIFVVSLSLAPPVDHGSTFPTILRL
jgi:hypothetical protein